MSPSRPRRLLFAAILALIPFLFLELALRAYFAFRVAPDLLLYGTPLYHANASFDPSAVERESLEKWKEKRNLIDHENYVGNYFKYFPRQKRFDVDAQGVRFEVTMNNLGFRGGDFTQGKSPHTFRVVTLGASSTFGYTNRDTETYPFVLEQLLNAGARSACGGIQLFEVYNLGIPHSRSENILSLLETEGLALQPDVVTFYEGVNDAARTDPAKDTVIQLGKRAPLLRKTFLLLRDRLVTFNLLDNLISNRPHEYTEKDLARHEAFKLPRFLDNVRRMDALCREKGITFIVATQQSKSLAVERTAMKGLTYLEERQMVMARLQSGPIRQAEFFYLIHTDLMSGLRDLAVRDGVPLVDVVDALDEDRDTLVSWVHLDPRGNRLAAEAFAARILEIACRQGPEPRPAHAS